MKNILKYTMVMVVATMMLASCSDDRDSNPVLQIPESFVLNTPAYANLAIDLEHSDSLLLTWSQPDYGGFPAATSYTIELSPTDDWTVSTTEAEADESGETIPTYYKVDNSYTSCTAGIKAEVLNKALVQIMNYTEDNLPPTEQKVYARVKAKTIGAPEITSNIVEFLVKPYLKLKPDGPVNPVLWYMVGNCIGSNDWDNGGGSVGTGLIPLLPDPDAEFDEEGNGTLVYAGFFPAGGQFKFVKIPGSWDTQMNYTNLEGDSPATDEDGDNHNIGIPEDGYYKITMNTVNNTFTLEKLNDTYTEYTKITMPGAYQGWDPDGNAMKPMGKRDNTQTHDWYVDATYEENTEVKFANGTWDINWGGETFPYGLGTQNGPNIPAEAGSYRVYFNDILGIYYFSVPE